MYIHVRGLMTLVNAKPHLLFDGVTVSGIVHVFDGVTVSGIVHVFDGVTVSGIVHVHS